MWNRNVKCQMSNVKCDKGQTLLELVVVVAVIVLIVGALVFAAISSLRNAGFAKNQAQATKLAQEGLEKVRGGRDRNQCITNLDADVNSWDGNSSNASCLESGSIWNYPITGSSSNCENTTVTGSKCYFKVDAGGSLNMIGYSQTSFPESFTEGIPATSPHFRRAVTLSDDALYGRQKTVTVIVQWKDFSGTHESKLSTVLRRIE